MRDRLSSDNWRLLNRLHQLMAGIAPTQIALDDALEVVDQTIVSLVAVGGLEMAHMTRDHGWRFLSLGRHLERLSFVASTLDDVASVGLPADAALLEWLLDLSDSLITYRARHMHYPEWTAVVDLLLFDDHNPRSGCFQLAKLAKHVQLLPGADPGDSARCSTRSSTGSPSAVRSTGRRASCSAAGRRSTTCSSPVNAWRCGCRTP